MQYKKTRTLYIFSIFLLFTQFAMAQTYSAQPLSRQDSGQVRIFEENYNLYSSRGDLRNASDFLNQIARIYWNHNHFETSADYYQRSLKLNEQLGNENGIAGINSNLGMIYSDLGEFQRSVDHLSKSVAARRVAKNTPLGKESLFNSLLNLSASLKQLGKYNEAIRYLEEALGLAQEINNLEKISIFYLQLAEANEAAGNEAESKNYLDKYMTFYKQMQDEYVSESRVAVENEMLRSEQISLENRLKELEIQKKTVELKEKDEQVKETESKADSLASNLSKSQLAQKIMEQEAQNEKIARQRNFIIFGAILTIVIIIAFLFYYAFRQKKKSNVKLSEKNTQILLQQEEIIQHRDKLNINNKELNRKNHQIMESIRYANLIQTAMLQHAVTLSDYIPDSFILFKPRDIVSGDFYWYTNKNDKLIVAAMDCTGHGVPGAFMSMIGANILNQIVINEGITEPNEILQELHNGVNTALNQELTGNNDGMDASLFVIDRANNELSFSGAKNPLILIKNNELSQLKGNKISVGGSQARSQSKFSKQTLNLDEELRIYSFSDGYQDQFGGEKDRKFMIKRFKNLLLEIHKKPMTEQQDILDRTIEEWKKIGNTEQTDDILVIGMHIN